MVRWHIDALSPADGFVFASWRAAGRDPWEQADEDGEVTQTVFMRAPAFEPEPASPAQGFGAVHAGFQERVFDLGGETELGFDDLGALREFVRRLYLGSGPGSTGGAPPERGPPPDLGPVTEPPSPWLGEPPPSRVLKPLHKAIAEIRLGAREGELRDALTWAFADRATQRAAAALLTDSAVDTAAAWRSQRGQPRAERLAEQMLGVAAALTSAADVASHLTDYASFADATAAEQAAAADLRDAQWGLAPVAPALPLDELRRCLLSPHWHRKFDLPARAVTLFEVALLLAADRRYFVRHDPLHWLPLVAAIAYLLHVNAMPIRLPSPSVEIGEQEFDASAAWWSRWMPRAGLEAPAEAVIEAWCRPPER